MKTSGPRLSADIRAQIEPPLIPLIKAESEEQKARKTIKVNIWRNSSKATPLTYKVIRYTFEDFQPEEFPALLRNWKIATDRTGKTSTSGRINYLRTLLCGSSLIEFYELELQANMNNNHFRIITEGLLD